MIATQTSSGSGLWMEEYDGTPRLLVRGGAAARTRARLDSRHATAKFCRKARTAGVRPRVGSFRYASARQSAE